MYFLLLALGIVAAGFVHSHLSSKVEHSPGARAELALAYLVSLYFGVVMTGMALFFLFGGDRAAAFLGAEPGNPYQEFTGILYLSMALIALVAGWVRGGFMVAAALLWSIYFFIATALHLVQFGEAGSLNVHSGGVIVLEHAVPGLLALGLLALMHRSRGTWPTDR